MAVLVLMLAFALGCCALTIHLERHRKMINGMALPWGFDYAPQLLLALGVTVAYLGGAYL